MICWTASFYCKCNLLWVFSIFLIFLKITKSLYLILFKVQPKLESKKKEPCVKFFNHKVLRF